jgi:hypothetical protein
MATLPRHLLATWGTGEPSDGRSRRTRQRPPETLGVAQSERASVSQAEGRLFEATRRDQLEPNRNESLALQITLPRRMIFSEESANFRYHAFAG